MHCLSVCQLAAGSSSGSITKTCPLTAYVKGIYQSLSVPSVLVTLKQKLHLVCSQIIVAPAPCQVAPWACAVPHPQQLEAGVTQDEER